MVKRLDLSMRSDDPRQFLNERAVGCYDCGLEYEDPAWIEAVIPDKVWNAIRPDGCGEGCGLLCITCISRRLEKKGYKKVPIWLCGTEPLRAMSGKPGDDLNILREWEMK